MNYCVFFYTGKKVELHLVEDTHNLQSAMSFVTGWKTLGVADIENWGAYYFMLEEYVLRYRRQGRNVYNDYSKFLHDYCPDIIGLLREASLIQSFEQLSQELNKICRISYCSLYSFGFWLSWRYKKKKHSEDVLFFENYAPKETRTRKYRVKVKKVGMLLP